MDTPNREIGRLLTDPSYRCQDCLIDLWVRDRFDLRLCWTECGIDRVSTSVLQQEVCALKNTPEKESEITIIETDVNVKTRERLDKQQAVINYLLNKVTELEQRKRPSKVKYI